MGAHYHFSPLDEIIPPLYFAYLLTFQSPINSSKELTFSDLSRSLKKLADEYPFLSGEISKNDSEFENAGQLSLIVTDPPEDIEIVQRDLTAASSGWTDTYEDLKKAGMPSSKLDAMVLAPAVAGITTRKIMSAQVNLITGGVIIAVCFSHAFVDAKGASVILGLWADLCRNLHQNSSSQRQGDLAKISQINIRPAILESNYNHLKLKPDLWKLLGLYWRNGPTSIPGTPKIELPLVIPAAARIPGSPKVKSKIFTFSRQSLSDLKSVVSLKTVIAGSDLWISTNDALVAFLWRHIMRARFPSADSFGPSESIVTVAVNGRKALSLPETYIGNVIFCSMTSLPISEIISKTTNLSKLAQAIRHNVNKDKTAGAIREALDLATCIPGEIIRSLRFGFEDFHGQDLVTTSWVDLPLYDMDWGQNLGLDGHIDFFRMPRGQFEGICCMQPRRNDMTVEVVISMKDEQMACLMKDTEFSKFATLAAE